MQIDATRTLDSDVPALVLRTGTGARILPAAFAITFGMAMTLCVQGYQFGHSNHTVYLIDALRRVNPDLLAHDWFTTRTLQYHAAFGWLTVALLRLGMLESGFLLGYLALVFLLHLGWYRLVFRLGGTRMTYLLSVLLFHLSAGGTGLGMYQFLQDGAFLPSNIANVAMLWGMYFWISGKPAWAGAWMGAAGLFHLNHAVVGIGLWIILSAWRWRDTAAGGRGFQKASGYVIGSVFALALSGLNIALALYLRAGRDGAMPLDEFVALYVRLRHPHHYDPSSWPVALWVCFLWPIPLAVMAAAHRLRGSASAAQRESVRQAGRVFLIFFGLPLVALLGAGVWYVSESLVQMSLYRFSIYAKLLSCIGTAYWVCDSGVLKPGHVRAIFIGTSALLAAGLFLFMVFDRFDLIPRDDPDYMQVCRWARDPENTPPDAVFLVPPQEQAFRLHAQRAIVVNFKGVPQLSTELGEWRDRMCGVLGLSDLTTLPRPFEYTFAAIGQHYESRTAADLINIAEKYGARYVVVGHRLEDLEDRRIAYRTANESYFLYDLTR